ncbi:nuclear transport factor 2 family protein [Pseudomonas sp. GCM10022188]|uniref:nuclear transport factor 2 family protein n=1 Tax=Pseudomonas TaxID=286 RepID=UPI001E47848B|nr:nuclear transport factor 2 family protein [Pseudomonas oryzagri]MCC6075873.1 nuclear transport factor 2 family protein [Pseudomonas oryzagri]
MPTSTAAVLEHHLEAFYQGIDAIMEDFTDVSVIITASATYRGLGEIRAFFSALLDGLPAGFDEAVKITRQEVVGEVAFLVWEARPWFPFCTDTFVVRNGKIAYQTFAAAGAA